MKSTDIRKELGKARHLLNIAQEAYSDGKDSWAAEILNKVHPIVSDVAHYLTLESKQ